MRERGIVERELLRYVSPSHFNSLTFLASSTSLSLEHGPFVVLQVSPFLHLPLASPSLPPYQPLLERAVWLSHPFADPTNVFFLLSPLLLPAVPVFPKGSPCSVWGPPIHKSFPEPFPPFCIPTVVNGKS
jgi:hypothetical protein